MPENGIEKLKKWIGQITELGLLLVALAIVLQVLIGNRLPFFGDISNNLTDLIGNLGDDGLVGLIATGVILWLFGKRSLI